MPVASVIELDSAGPRQRILIGLHGRGSRPEHLLRPVKALRLQNTQVMLPRGLIKHPIVGGRAWYSGTYLDPSTEHALEVEAARAVIANLVAEATVAVGSKHVWLLGFSQGGIMALHTALTATTTLAGVAVLSGGWFHPSGLGHKMTSAGLQTPVFWGHGTLDAVLPIAAARTESNALSAEGVHVEFREYPMDHTVSRVELDDVRQFLTGAQLYSE